MSKIIMAQTLDQANMGNHIILGQTLHGLEQQNDVSLAETISSKSSIATRVRRSLEENRFKWLKAQVTTYLGPSKLFIYLQIQLNTRSISLSALGFSAKTMEFMTIFIS